MSDETETEAAATTEETGANPPDLTTIFPPKSVNLLKPKMCSLTVVCKPDFMGLIAKIASENNITQSETGFLLINQRLNEIGLTDDNGSPLIEVENYVAPRRASRKKSK